MDDSPEHLRYPIGRYEPPDRYEPALQTEWIMVLEALPTWLEQCIENLDAPQLETPFRPGGWTVNQIIHHIADCNLHAFIRTKSALTEESPVIAPFNQGAWAELPDVYAVPVNVTLTMLHALHRTWGALLRNIDPEDWVRDMYHPEQERYIPVWELTDFYVWHSRHHTEQIRRLRDRMNW